MARDSSKVIIFLFFGASMLFSYIIRIFERPFYRAVGPADVNYRQLDALFNANYWIIVTMTTVGYGDIIPGTWMGRLTIIIATLTGSFIMAIFIG